MKWNDDWRNELEKNNYPCYERLCECRNTRKDLKIIFELMYKYNSDKQREESLIRTLEWIGDWNNQFEVADLTKEEYNNLLLDID